MTNGFHQHTLRNPEAVLRTYCPLTSVTMQMCLKTGVPSFTAALLPTVAASERVPSVAGWEGAGLERDLQS